MKTAISLPDPIFAEAEELAERLGTSRSALYARAIAAYLETHRKQSLTARMNRVCDEIDTRADPILTRMQAMSMDPGEEW